MFDFPLLHGSHQHFKDKYSVFLSKELAQKMFNDADPTGTALSLHFQNEKVIPVTVGGVFDKIPDNNTFYFDALMHFEHYLNIHELQPDSWSDWRDPATFFELTNVENASQIGDQLGKFIAVRNDAKQDIEVKSYQLEPFHANIYGDDTRLYRWHVLVALGRFKRNASYAIRLHSDDQHKW